ncbi:DNA phosphorothioation system restriction enzyme [Geotalea uraniireducens]|uniref:Type III restriction enzyme, res subunit n=1 Tax=Geotalea uraniireducens (strain Rf4) TaxID=351605 RepID=A5G4E1_GEOUR|nr:DNA phosphorothioation system restriction enzyme [Geotalea uraniireducens]ABQ26659.1 type III restriction enzyme, res subunit [Geotalea uraniireducens Rf4]
MPNLSDITINLSYRTGRDDLVRDFFIPCLESSVLYRRAAGYFTSAGLALAASGVASLASRRGKMKLVVSPYLEPADVEALQAAASNPADALRAIAARSLAGIEDALIKDRLNALAWLAAAGLLEIKLALRLDARGGFSRGIFHEKTGIFTDRDGNLVAFSGSSNETAGGLVENFESIKVFCSWRDQEGRVQEEVENFEALWNDSTPGLRIMEFSEAGKELLERFRDLDKPPAGLSLDRVKEPGLHTEFIPPKSFELRPYQADAIRAWSKAGGKGIFAMATGSGKTLTALTLASKVAEKNRPLVLIVVCPFINLCRQWLREMAAFGLQPVACFEGKDRWQAELEEGYQRLSVGLSQVHAIVATNATFQSESFQARIRPRVATLAVHHLLIADEVHNLGAERIREALPDGIALRLGLSATPERHYDPVGTSAVLDYFGNIVYEYPLSSAIADGRLCRYRYYPIPVELTETETDAYEEITTKLAKFFSKGDDDSEMQQVAMRLLIKRARLLAGAENKLAALDRVIASLPEPPKKAIFYCGDGRTTDAITDEEVRQIQAVSRLLGERHGLRVRNFTFRESTEEREEILRDLTSGFLDGVVAIRCLDEGIDLPDLRMGFLLASSTNPRQFVQRRGRLLRNSPGKNRAIIYDFIVQPPDLGGSLDDDGFNMERSFFQRELSRIVEFCRMAENGPEALHSLHDLRLKYNLLSE